jgi:predicted O-methyltransferase YrrM
VNIEDYTSLDHFAYDQVDMAPHFRTLIRYARECRTIIEWGVRGGVSTWAFLDGLPEDGLLVSVDINDCVVPRRVSQDPRWVFIVGDDLDPAVRAQLPPTADIVFIDTSHTYEQTVAELEIAPDYRPDRIVMHDVNQPQVRQAVDEFCAREGWTMAAYEDPYGLATLVPGGGHIINPSIRKELGW